MISRPHKPISVEIKAPTSLPLATALSYYRRFASLPSSTQLRVTSPCLKLVRRPLSGGGPSDFKVSGLPIQHCVFRPLQNKTSPGRESVFKGGKIFDPYIFNLLCESDNCEKKIFFAKKIFWKKIFRKFFFSKKNFLLRIA